MTRLLSVKSLGQKKSERISAGRLKSWMLSPQVLCMPIEPLHKGRRQPERNHLHCSSRPAPPHAALAAVVFNFQG
jgi:hypothetical protein